MLPFGPRLTTVFASRWKALFWAAGVMVTAYFTASEARHDGPPDSSAAAVEQAPTGASSTSPWAK
ncbi:hypothetical protein [Novosphingobium sp. KACC 22771]|uniref:hypothetical protein n=1 Tax=Novosphingobium sp. KACC 22771 TaxID=3025670 RepID=UPI0023661B41|nr:hypothetical protein [Novosphingobium sp. KACC 22771]WDF72366.1 hypothetical protein PQ467_16510 [Novosphingobium sp. KACC 22771]